MSKKNALLIAAVAMACAALAGVVCLILTRMPNRSIGIIKSADGPTAVFYAKKK